MTVKADVGTVSVASGPAPSGSRGLLVSAPANETGSKSVGNGGTSGVGSGSMFSRGFDSEVGGGNLRGPPESFVVRVEVEVYNPQVIGTILQKGFEDSVLDTFVTPVKMPFIQNRTNSPLGKQPTPLETTQEKPGSAKNRASLSDREFEMRSIMEGLFSEIFKDVLNMTETKEQVSVYILNNV